MDDEQLDILAWTMLGEAAGEGAQGMADVGHVVLNRLETGRWGSTIKDVAQANKQFSAWNSGAGGNDPQGKYPKSSPAFQRARQLAQQVVAGQIQGPPGKPLDYHATNITPYWADSKDKFGAIVRNGHKFYPSVPIPPGEVPNSVGSLTDTIPRAAPAPVTATPDMAMMRRAAAPSQLIPDTFAGISKGSGTANLGDQLAMSPIQGGRQQAPMFDAGFDERLGAMRLLNSPMDTQGMFTASSKPPAPTPAMMSPQMAGTRSTDPVLQAALNARYPTQLPPLPQSVPQVSASDLARGNSGISTVASYPTTGIGQPPVTRAVQSIPVPLPQPMGSNYQAVAGFSGGSTVPFAPTQLAAIPGPTAPAKFPDRLLPSGGIAGNTAAIMDAHGLTDGQIGIGGAAIAPTPFMRPPGLGNAPFPRPRPRPVAAPVTAAASVPPKIAPIPFMRPDFGMGGPALNGAVPTQGLAPTPMPRLQRKGLSIGPFQVGGPIGAITRAMANSSGPFNNGGDNALYNLMRGGDFNTPGAATHQSTSGYLFAQNGQGGFLNVGRADPGLTPAQTYYRANARDSRGNTQGGFASEGKSDWFRQVTGN